MRVLAKLESHRCRVGTNGYGEKLNKNGTISRFRPTKVDREHVKILYPSSVTGPYPFVLDRQRAYELCTASATLGQIGD
jgi:hypothetical protein